MSNEHRFKQNIYNTTRKLCKEVGQQLNVHYDTEGVDIIGELVYKKLLIYASDLEAFQKHAKRSIINTDDVKLIVRRNDSLKEMVDAKLQEIAAAKPAENSTGGNKRKRKATTSTG